MDQDQTDIFSQEETVSTEDHKDSIEMTTHSSRSFLGRLFTWKSGVPPKWLVLLAPMALNIGFGMYPVILKLFARQSGQEASHGANPFVFTFYRAICAFPVLFTASYLVEGSIPLPSARMILVFLSFGFFGIFACQFTYIAGAFIVDADIASAFQPLTPVWSSIVTVVFCTEPPPSVCMLHTWTKIVGIFVATGGAIELALAGYEPEMITGNQNSIHISKQAMGYVCLLMDTFFSAMYYTLQKKLVYMHPNCSWRHYPMAMTGYAYLFGSMFMGLFVLYYLVTGQTEVFHIPQQSLPALVYAVFITSAFCYFLITWSNKYLPSSVMTAFWPLQVVSTVIAAYLILGDTLSHTQILAASAIIGGLLLVIYSNRVAERLSLDGKGGVRLDNCFKTDNQRT